MGRAVAEPAAERTGRTTTTWVEVPGVRARVRVVGRALAAERLAELEPGMARAKPAEAAVAATRLVRPGAELAIRRGRAVAPTRP